MLAAGALSALLYGAPAAPLGSPKGLLMLERLDALTLDERERLLQSARPHSTVVVWLTAGLTSATGDGRLSGGDPVRLTLLSKLTELRAT